MSSSVKHNIVKHIEFYNIVRDIISNDTVQKMKDYRQHYNTSTYEHCFNVAFLGYQLCRKFHLDYIAFARSAMVHDLFLYDWRGSSKNLEGFHAFVHPKIALKNAKQLFELTNKEKDIIAKHMWPVTFFHFPKYLESFIITIVDKYCAIYESLSFYCSHVKKKRVS